jgi:environmental stress-induced protein Ves
MQVLRAVDYSTQPWKNGGGLTREILKVPPQASDFDWRLSLATIQRPGPFSTFADYDRTLILVDGAGVHLDFGTHGHTVLRAPGESAAFDGAWSTTCTLIGGCTTDLNLIVAKTRAQAESRVLRLTTPERVGTSSWEETLICCIQGAARIDTATGERTVLSALDVARCRPEDGELICAPDSAPALVLAAVVRHLPA